MDDHGSPPVFTRRLRPAELVGLDVLAAAVLALAAVAAPAGTPGWARWTAAVSTGLPIAVRRRRPVPVLVLVLTATVVLTCLDVLHDQFVAAALAAYSAAAVRHRPRAEPTLLIGAVSVLAAIVVTAGGQSPKGGPLGPLLVGVVVVSGAWTLGRAVRERRERGAASAARLAAQAVTQERLRIARELHDVVSHTLSMIGIKAAVAAHVADRRPDEALDALRLIETTSREALVQMHHMLGLLRADQTPAGLDPVPRLADLPTLCARAEQAGVRVELDLVGLDQVPGRVEPSVFRIVQEAVTNVIKHAAPTRCRIQVHGSPHLVRVSVADDGPPRPRASAAGGGPGHGLIGMRERTAIHGGRFAAGHRPRGGFLVTADLPVDGMPQTDVVGARGAG